MSDPAARPQVGVGGVLVRGGKVLLIRRGKEPLRGRWVVPGGTVEPGETLQQALVREMREETGLEVAPEGLLTVLDAIHRDGGRLVYHYVILDYLCRYVSGEASAGSDAEALAWAGPDELDDFDLPPKAREVVEDAFARVAARHGGGAGGEGLASGPPGR
jgi:8-oxo-dGTP diphosphatase